MLQLGLGLGLGPGNGAFHFFFLFFIFIFFLSETFVSQGDMKGGSQDVQGILRTVWTLVGNTGHPSQF